jgi:glycogen/starch synthases, ADP-glucose type
MKLTDGPASPRAARVLFAASEALPFIKTGGLADVAYALPKALAAAGFAVRVALPAYRGILRVGEESGDRLLAEHTAYGHRFRVIERASEQPGLSWWLLDCPELFDRPGSPYADERGWGWSDNAWRYGVLSRLLAELACHGSWLPDIVHLNDWHTALTAAWLREWHAPLRTVFTIHNLAYQGQFGRREFDALGLPAHWWHVGGLEFHGDVNFIKAGILFADRLTTVSPTYAREIQTSRFGEGLDGALRSRAAALHGICNGVDTEAWNPATDAHLPRTYNLRTARAGKSRNKLALQNELGLEPSEQIPLIAFIGRLARQKGADLLLALESWFAQRTVQLVVLGSGEPELEQAFRAWAARNPKRVAAYLGYHEALAHRIEAASDLFVMPSRYEPCGLNQMYSQIYGSLPVVRRTGGLSDTVIDTTPATLADGTASGVLFDHDDPGGLHYGLTRGLEILAQPKLHRAVQKNGMTRDFGWQQAAAHYIALYLSLLPSVLPTRPDH